MHRYVTEQSVEPVSALDVVLDGDFFLQHKIAVELARFRAEAICRCTYFWCIDHQITDPFAGAQLDGVPIYYPCHHALGRAAGRGVAGASRSERYPDEKTG